MTNATKANNSFTTNHPGHITWCFFCLFVSFFLVYLDFGIYIKSVDQIRLFSRAVMLRQGHRPMTVLYVSSDSASTPSPCKEGHGNKLVACAGSSFSQHYAANDGEESHPEFHQKTNKQSTRTAHNAIYVSHQKHHLDV